MAARRLERIARVIRESVSSTLLTRLSDPRIQGLVTVTEVEVAPDLRQATVYLSVSGRRLRNLPWRLSGMLPGFFRPFLVER